MVIQEAIIVLATFANDSVIVDGSGGDGGERGRILTRSPKKESELKLHLFFRPDGGGHTLLGLKE